MPNQKLTVKLRSGSRYNWAEATITVNPAASGNQVRALRGGSRFADLAPGYTEQELRRFLRGKDYTMTRYTLTAADGWHMEIEDLPAQDGTYHYSYYVIETAIDGYTTTYAGGGLDPVTITNERIPTYELPKTGGGGAEPFTICGLALIGLALAWSTARRYRRKRGDAVG